MRLQGTRVLFFRNAHFLTMQSSFRGVDREEEDRYRQIEFNRNPRLHSHTAAEKLRSDRIGMKATGLRDVSLKAKVVNKIVRDASGIHTYTLVPPPRAIDEVIEMDADPETNARVKSYTKETKKKAFSDIIWSPTTFCI